MKRHLMGTIILALLLCVLTGTALAADDQNWVDLMMVVSMSRV